MKIQSSLTHFYAAAAVMAISSAAAVPVSYSAAYAASLPDTTREVVNLDEFVITARRPMQEIGVQKTTFDSIALKENIALSMADVLTFNSSVFVKNAGRATLSTIALKATTPLQLYKNADADE